MLFRQQKRLRVLKPFGVARSRSGARPALWFVVVAMYAVTTVPRLWPAVVLSAVAAIISAAFPGWGYLAVTISNAVLMAFPMNSFELSISMMN